MKARLIVLAAAAGLLLAACGGANDTGSNADRSGGGMGTEAHDMDSMASDDFDFGAPADDFESERSVRIQALDSLEFSPSTVDVDAGETVTFVVTNEGQTDHEFTLGDEDFQEAHEQEMDMDSMNEDDAYSFQLAPGETKKLTWTFAKSGKVLYGCHEPGHYEGGMVGTITVG